MKHTLALLTALLVLVAGPYTAKAATVLQWTVAEGGNGHFFEVVNLIAPVSWEEAKLQSEVAGGYLATVTSQEENDWIVSNLLLLVVGTPHGRAKITREFLTVKSSLG